MSTVRDTVRYTVRESEITPPVPENALENVDTEPLKFVDGEYIETVD